MPRPCEVMIASSDSENCETVAGVFSQRGVDPVCVSTVDQCRQIFNKRAVSLVLCDLELSDGRYSDVLAAAAAFAKKMPKVVVMSRLIKFREYNEAKWRGVLDVVTPPSHPADVEWMLFWARRYSSIPAILAFIKCGKG
jgi:DNA-binding NtrC family response regulator